MNTFANAVNNQTAYTTNGMRAQKSTGNANVNLFFDIGASRGKNIIPEFTAAYVEDKDVALRIAQWARDIRGGSGERQLFRDILLHLEKHDTDAAKALIRKVPEIGRWDDLLIFQTKELKDEAYSLILKALNEGNGLCAKWLPRQGLVARELREFFGWSPKFYRKRLVELTKVVETQMCAKDWDNINFNHVPSVASSRYKKAFGRHTPKYKEWVEDLVKGKEGVKVNASAVYPYDVLKGLISTYIRNNYDKTQLDHIKAQWDALPNYVGEANILPLIDVSGSMYVKAGGQQSKSNVTCADVAVSLGLYLADKNKGKFKDIFLTFSSDPELVRLKGNILEKISQITTSKWGMSTDLEAALRKILDTAVKNKVPQNEMPEALLILSDMQFNQCISKPDATANSMIKKMYKDAGYKVPGVVYWNLNAHDNVPVKADKDGVALVSGFSPAIVKSVLAADLDKMSPESIMMDTIMVPRYQL